MTQASVTVKAETVALRAEGLVKRFGKRQALDAVNLEVPRGAAAGLVGANGAGKTTFIKCALDLCATDAGRVDIFGVENNGVHSGGIVQRMVTRLRLCFWQRMRNDHNLE